MGSTEKYVCGQFSKWKVHITFLVKIYPPKWFWLPLPHPSWVVPGVERASRSWAGVLVNYKGYFCLSGMGPLLNVAPLLTIHLILPLTLNLLKTKRDEKRGPQEKCTKGKHCPLRLVRSGPTLPSSRQETTWSCFQRWRPFHMETRF